MQTNPYPDPNIRGETACINKYVPIRKLSLKKLSTNLKKLLFHEKVSQTELVCLNIVAFSPYKMTNGSFRPFPMMFGIQDNILESHP